MVTLEFQYSHWWFLTWLELGDTLTDTFNCTSPLMAQDDREKSLRVISTQSVGICMTHRCSKELRGKVLI